MPLASIESASLSIRFVERNLLNVKQIVHEGWIDYIDIPITPEKVWRILKAKGVAG
jgi:predicted DNA-binding transcriptional regulator